MGYYISSMIGIRTGGVGAGGTDMDDLKRRLRAVAKQMEAEDWLVDFDTDDPSHCMSQELVAHKGSYVVIAGVFNYWDYSATSEFARRLSKEFGTEVMVMTWDEERDQVQCNIFLDGEELLEVAEHPIGRILRRVT